MMNWLIAGGSGRIGAALTADLLKDGHEVNILGRHSSSPRLRWDARTLGDWAAEVERADVVVNLAGERLAGPNPFTSRWTAARKQRICTSRQWAGKALAAAVTAAQTKPEVLIQSSGIDYYPVSDRTATEQTPPGDDFLSHVCAECWEPSTEAVEQQGVRRVVLRTGPTLSLILPPLALQSRLFLGGPLGDGTQWVSWVHMEDVIRTIRFLAAREDAHGAFNLCSPHPVTNAEFSKVLGQVLRRPSSMRTPAFLMRLAYGEMADTLLFGVRAEPTNLLDSGFPFRFPDLEPALRNMLSR
jgi:uncharacterized protein (TIGR01777 family)